MKIYRRIGTWVMIGLLLLASLGVAAITKYNAIQQQNTDWKQNLIQQNRGLEKTMSEQQMTDSVHEQLKEQYAINQHRIENDIAPAENTLWGFMNRTVDLTSLITLFTVIVGATSVAGEFSWGTVKLLLIRSVTRTKILLSKYLSTLLFALSLLAILFLFSFLLGSAFFGIGDWGSPYLTYENGQVAEKSMVVHVISLFGLECVNLLLMVTFAFMISTVFRSSSLAIGLSIFLMFTGSTAVGVLAGLDQEWGKYLLFANTDLTQYVDGQPMFQGMSLSFSITVLTVYFLLFNTISWLLFNKRDVAG
ncbi:hypothetical protein CHM34_03995 [Paludifilum halophilum]|uniref:ABC transporter permease n=2 Tax=Paludifilum halophilum TaxID=1642702 RepID=A0A235BA52_9BACL|nr:hypothetical protein CHM34_03995 [Paludifilum halophilum]